MKIIAVSNFNNETQSDRLVAKNIQSEYEANLMAEALNDAGGANNRDYFIAVKDDHVLYSWEP